MANTDTEKDTGARILTGIGIILIPMAILMPWVVVHFDLKSLGDFGAVGDFIGGTTVTFLTGASVFLLIATNIMQRKELQMSRQSIDEMVKQTKASVEQMAASVQQAEEARKETQITNETMKRQQFETTFFNMINLQHNILKEIQYGSSTGREAILKLYKELRITYSNQVYKQYKTQFTNNIIISRDSDKLNDLIQKILIDKELSYYTSNFEKFFVPAIGSNGKSDFRERDFFYKSINDGTDGKWEQIKDQVIDNFERNIKNNREKCVETLEEFDLKEHIKREVRIEHEYITEFKMNYSDNPLTELKHEAYETLYKKHENVIGHYYRNLYRIVKLIQNNVFDSESHERDNEEKRKYRGILRAQLSSFELLMIFYNISYSEKGKKFKELVAGVNFFDDHLIEKDFIWENDVEELASLNASKGIVETNSI
ncbi:putative phage abortive infection protein [Bacillus paranthracis]|uniref:putative phage abortive infection protein n=1 Tax=Bacillus cereus group TaxID=86661 RepID=UPI00159B9366|nr:MULTISPECIES: putative phage abortive infection protein [Bacillus cereus group]MBJ7945699.1 putative phage abortive infection protein [Bacillus cereus group sp. N24]MCU5387141.1 putative phage abortive infection protein [Bacillus paranthracis]